jgi:F-type H+-transporting ATPase subunit gamma
MKITRAFELIAASRIVRAQQRVRESLPYIHKLTEVIRNVGAAGGSSSHILLEQREVRTVGVLPITSDRGLAGAYNTNVLRAAESRLLELRRDGIEHRLYVVGKKAQGYFRFRGYHVRRAFLGVTDRPGYGDARAVANHILDEYASGEIDQLDVVYNRFQSALNQVTERIEMLPVRAPEDRDGEGPPVSYEFEPSPEEILDRILPRYVEAGVFGMLLEASAGEHAARQRAMKAATDNARDLVKLYTRQANQARQAEITTEISEIVGGAEALRPGSEK